MDDEQKKSPVKQTKHFNFLIVKDWIAIAVSIFGIIAFFRGCSHETEINNLNFEVMSLTHQPRLKPIGFPETIRTNIDSLSVNIKENPDKHSGTKSDPHTLNIGFKITIESRIKVTNTSANALGKIIALISTDTIPRIKGLITGEY
jgi:hypothetical protein